MSDRAFILGAEKISHYYGEWPVFHDAEVTRLELQRDPLRIELDLLTQDRLPELVVRLSFDEVQDVEFGGFNHQNALLAMLIAKREDGWTYVDLESAHGLGGAFRCQTVTVLDVRQRI